MNVHNAICVELRQYQWVIRYTQDKYHAVVLEIMFTTLNTCVYTLTKMGGVTRVKAWTATQATKFMSALETGSGCTVNLTLLAVY